MKKALSALLLFLMSAVSVSASTDYLNDANLQAYYRLESNSNDYKAYANGVDTSVSYVSGKFGQAANYSGSAYTVLGGNSQFDDDVFSVSLWFKTAGGGQIIVSKQSASAYRVNLYMDGSGHLQMSQQITSATYNDNTWHHVLYTKAAGTNGTETLYVDGALAVSGAGQLYNSVTNYPLTIGAQANNLGTKFTGTIDDLAVFTRVLNGTDAADLYASGTGLEIYCSHSGNCSAPPAGPATSTNFFLTGTTSPATDSQNLHYIVGLGTIAFILLTFDLFRRMAAGLTR